MKRLAILLLPVFGCAHAAPVSREPITYSCALETNMCRLVDAAAAHATLAGFRSVRDDALGTLLFVPAPVRTVFTERDVPTINRIPLIDPALLPNTPILARHGNTVEVTALRGGLQRDGDLVEHFIDVFEGNI